jgi:hypothetical protein
MQFRRDIFWRSFWGRCVNCDQMLRTETGFKGLQLMNIPDDCPHCHMVLRRRDGFFLGAIVWNYGLIVFGVLPLILLGYHWDWYTGKTAVTLSVGAALILPFLIHNLAWRIWIGLYYAFLPEQLPKLCRRTDD